MRCGGNLRRRDYEIQMTAYALALMKALNADRAISELWYLKTPMKIVRREYRRDAAEGRLTDLFSRYFAAVEMDEWPLPHALIAIAVECGFRHHCWGST